ncbi:MAG: hypothetical protein ACRCSV_05455 [Chlamydiales bacterium]
MSISNTTFNTGIIGVYAYSLYRVYNETSKPISSQIVAKENEIQNEVDPVLEDKIAAISSELLLENEIRSEMKPLLKNKYEIVVSDGKHQELSLFSATVNVKSLKRIVINSNLYNTDKEVCRFLVRRNIKHYELQYHNLFRRLLIGSIAQVAISVLSMQHSWHLLNTMGVSLFVNGAIYSTAAKAIKHICDRDVIRESSDQELLGAQRFFKALKELNGFSHEIPSDSKHAKQCMEEIDRRILARCFPVDLEKEEEKIDSLKTYLEPYICS